MTLIGTVWRRALPALAVLMVAGVGGVAAVQALGLVVNGLRDGADVHLDLQFLGVAQTDASVADVRKSLGRDAVFALLYGLGLFAIVRRWKGLKILDAKLQSLGRALRWSPLIAGLADMLENLLTAVFLRPRTAPNAVAIEYAPIARLVTTLALVKWASLVGAVGLLIWRVSSWAIARPRHAESRAQPQRVTEGLALTFSGGGIRSAGFSLGALHALEQDAARAAGRGEGALLAEVRTITAVSGGNYAATGWLLHRMDGCSDAAARTIGGLVDGWSADSPPSIATVGGNADGRHRFLANGPGALPRAVVWALLAVASNVVQVAAVLAVVAWPLGRLISSRLMYPNLVSTRAGELVWSFEPTARLWVPPLVIAGLGAGIAMVAAATRNGLRATRIATVAAVTLGAGALVGFVTTVAPWLLVEAEALGSDRQAFTLGGVGLASVAGALLRLVQNPLRRNASRLGGVALALMALLFGGKVSLDAAADRGWFSSPWFAAAAATIFILSAFVADTQSLSVRELYRARLTNSFVPERRRPVSIWKRIWKKPDAPVGTTWEEVAAATNIPDLVVCCAASRVGLAPSNGVPAESFTVSASTVSHYRSSGAVHVSTAAYTAELRSMALKPLQGPAGWMATSGAAFASAMGGLSLGSTNALLAALNVDLGVWLPAPQAVADGRTSFPPARLGHLVNEIFGLYGPDDEQVFVSDGGHVENLGLVEALRLGHRQVLCFDASGDRPGSFSTFRAALRMADTELTADGGQRLYFDTKELDGGGEWAADVAYRIDIYDWGNRRVRIGWIVFAKLQRAENQPDELRRMANADPSFPHFSTGNQLLTDRQFIALVEAGRHAGQRALTRVPGNLANGRLGPAPQR